MLEKPALTDRWGEYQCSARVMSIGDKLSDVDSVDMDKKSYRVQDISQVISVCKGILAFFAATDVLYVLMSLVVQGRTPSFGSIALILICGIVPAGLLYLHFLNDTMLISESGIETRGWGNFEWPDVIKVTIAKRTHARSQRVDTIICIYHGQKGVLKISSSPEETAQILLLLEQYVGDRISGD